MSYYPYNPYYFPPIYHPQYLPINPHMNLPPSHHPQNLHPHYYPPYFPPMYDEHFNYPSKHDKEVFQKLEQRQPIVKNEQEIAGGDSQNQIKLTSQKHQKHSKIIFKNQPFTIQKKREEEYNLHSQKKYEKKTQKQGRNNNSNVFRAFVKIIVSQYFQPKLVQLFKKIKMSHNLKVEFEEFRLGLRQNLPKFTNYINNRQFRKLYRGHSEFNKILRILFRYFQTVEGFSHILTVSHRDRIRKENLNQFLMTLHSIDSTII